MREQTGASTFSGKEMVMREVNAERCLMGVVTVSCAVIALGGSVGLGVLEKKRTQEQIAVAKTRGQVSKWQELERRRARMSHATVSTAVSAR